MIVHWPVGIDNVTACPQLGQVRVLANSIIVFPPVMAYAVYRSKSALSFSTLL
jgi:hypothetical protein